MGTRHTERKEIYQVVYELTPADIHQALVKFAGELELQMGVCSEGEWETELMTNLHNCELTHAIVTLTVESISRSALQVLPL